ncbi:4'-phosphopantetheinyl transferase superfamily protein [bacterium D16-51]|nr:4'-phosphopantetheinyl transferase superfamily protein [bacterium D16-59]RKI61698.1 4'-phosphopantetheinyl transferase superfamily protein [bacterium D16-51]
MRINMYKIYQMDTKQLENPYVFQKYYQEVTDSRRQKVDSFRMMKDKKLSLAAGVLLNQGLKEQGLLAEKEKIVEGENGKPYLPGNRRVYFNISHSEERAIAVFSDAEAGCDIEYVKNFPGLGLAERFFCPEEYRYILKQEEKSQAAAFYRLWTLKESFLKASGFGLKLPLNQFCISLEGEIQVKQQVNRKKYYLEEWRDGEYQIAVCLEQPLQSISRRGLKSYVQAQQFQPFSETGHE